MLYLLRTLSCLLFIFAVAVMFYVVFVPVDDTGVGMQKIGWGIAAVSTGFAGFLLWLIGRRFRR